MSCLPPPHKDFLSVLCDVVGSRLLMIHRLGRFNETGLTRLICSNILRIALLVTIFISSEKFQLIGGSCPTIKLARNLINSTNKNCTDEVHPESLTLNCFACAVLKVKFLRYRPRAAWLMSHSPVIRLIVVDLNLQVLTSSVN